MFFSIHLVHLGLQSEYISDIPAASVFLLHTYLYFHTHNTAVSYDFRQLMLPVFYLIIRITVGISQMKYLKILPASQINNIYLWIIF